MRQYSVLLKLQASSLQTGSSLASVSLKPLQHSYERLPALPKLPSGRKKAAIEQHNAVKKDNRICNSPVCSLFSVVEFTETGTTSTSTCGNGTAKRQNGIRSTALSPSVVRKRHLDLKASSIFRGVEVGLIRKSPSNDTYHKLGETACPDGPPRQEKSCTAPCPAV